VSAPKHTPGPWSIDETPVEYVAIRGPGDAPVWLHSVAEIEVLGGDDEQERVARANAKLIAAAPALADALGDTLWFIEKAGPLGAALLARARAALRAAGRLP